MSEAKTFLRKYLSARLRNLGYGGLRVTSAVITAIEIENATTHLLIRSMWQTLDDMLASAITHLQFTDEQIADGAKFVINGNFVDWTEANEAWVAAAALDAVDGASPARAEAAYLADTAAEAAYAALRQERINDQITNMALNIQASRRKG